MNNNEFKDLIYNSFEEIKSLLTEKGKEYSEDEDRLSNFKQISFLQDNIPEKALLNLVSKHIITLFNKISNLNNIEDKTKIFTYIHDTELKKYDEYILIL